MTEKGEEYLNAFGRTAIDIMDQLYPRIKLSERDLDWRSRVRQVMMTIDPDSTPGFPYNKLGGNNGKVFETSYDLILELAVDRLKRMERMTLEEFESMSPEERCLTNLSDVFKVTVKEEPHSESKMRSGRMRLIFMLGVVQQIVQKVVMGKYQKACIENWDIIPSKPGMGFSDEHTDTFGQKYFGTGRDGYPLMENHIGDDISEEMVANDDISGWDFAQTARKGRFVREFRAGRFKGPIQVVDTYAKMSKMLHHADFHKLVAFSNGVVISVEGYIWPSGSYQTSSCNSDTRTFFSITEQLYQAYAHYRDFDKAYREAYYRAIYMASNGDDHVCIPAPYSTTEERMQFYLELGIVLTDVQYKSFVPYYSAPIWDGDDAQDVFEFCSHKYYWEGGKVRAFLANWPRTLFRLLQNKPSEDLLMQFVYELRHHPQLAKILCFIYLRCGWQPEKINHTDNSGMEKKLSKHEKKEVKGEVSNALAKNGIKTITSSELKVPKNMRVAEEAESHLRNQYRGIIKKMRSAAYLPPEIKRYVELLDNPFEAPWGDTDEPPVRAPIYNTNIPPSATQTMRCFGTKRFTISAGNTAWIGFSPSPANMIGNSFALNQDLAHDTHYNGFIATRVSSTPSFKKRLIGCPFDGQTYDSVTNGGGTSCGYMYQTPDPAHAPIADLNSTLLLGSHGTVDGPTMLTWANTETLGQMVPGDAGVYQYRCTAAGIRVVPLDAMLHVGGAIESAVIPNGSNEGYATSSAGTPNTGGATKILSLPNHVIKSGRNIYETRWLPGENDFDFYVNVPDTATQFNAQFAGNCREFIRITPGDASANSVYEVQYVAFYEIAGACVAQNSIVPRPNPQCGAKVISAVQGVLQRDIDEKVQKEQVKDSTTMEVVKDHPTIGPLIEGNVNTRQVESTFDKIVDSIGSIASFAGPIIGALL